MQWLVFVDQYWSMRLDLEALEIKFTEPIYVK